MLRSLVGSEMCIRDRGKGKQTADVLSLNLKQRRNATKILRHTDVYYSVWSRHLDLDLKPLHFMPVFYVQEHPTHSTAAKNAFTQLAQCVNEFFAAVDSVGSSGNVKNWHEV